MVKQGERRKSFRIPFTAEVVCRPVNGSPEYKGRLRDVSISGLFMETDGCPPVGTVCDVDIILRGERSRLVIEELRGKVIRSEDEGFAILFDDNMEWLATIPIYHPKVRQQDAR